MTGAGGDEERKRERENYFTALTNPINNFETTVYLL